MNLLEINMCFVTPKSGNEKHEEIMEIHVKIFILHSAPVDLKVKP